MVWMYQYSKMWINECACVCIRCRMDYFFFLFLLLLILCAAVFCVECVCCCYCCCCFSLASTLAAVRLFLLIIRPFHHFCTFVLWRFCYCCWCSSNISSEFVVCVCMFVYMSNIDTPWNQSNIFIHSQTLHTHLTGLSIFERITTATNSISPVLEIVWFISTNSPRIKQKELHFGKSYLSQSLIHTLRKPLKCIKNRMTMKLLLRWTLNMCVCVWV